MLLSPSCRGVPANALDSSPALHVLVLSIMPNSFTFWLAATMFSRLQ